MKFKKIVTFKTIFIATCISFCLPFTPHAKVLHGVSLAGNRDLPGGDYAQYYARNAEECLKKCANDRNCAAYSFTSAPQSCLLKAYIPEAVHVSGMISGYKLYADGNNNMAPSPSGSGIEGMVNTDLPGGDYHRAPIENTQTCSQLCLYSPLCKGYTYNKSSKICWLKNQILGDRHSTGHNSGIKAPTPEYRPEPPLSSTYDMEIMRKTDIPGGDYNQVYLNNARECSHYCREDNYCDAFTFVKSGGICMLKSFQVRPMHKRGNISGIKR